jgi:TOMM system kinase/cyclase fusion protein
MSSESHGADDPDRLLGKVLGGQFRIEGHLGTGGFGDVYRAVQEKTGQLVALKLLKPRYGKGAPAMERQLARFRREMKVCAELHHAHVVRLIDSGETDDGLLFSVFEYVPGPTLAELLREKGALTVRAAIDLMSQVLDALVCAHGKGVIHRDLKPNNIMVSTTGARPQATVLDFGISAFLEGMIVDEFKSLTVTREILGTPAYAAPEQLRGEPPTIKSDLYAWGLVFLECIVGRRAYDGPSSMEIAHRQLSPDPVALPARLQKHWLGTLLKWTLEKDAGRRAGDAALLMERLLEKRGLGDLVDQNGYFVENENDEMATTARNIIAESPLPATGGAVGAGERRQLTAVCCSIGVRPNLPARPPETLDQALRDAQALCVQVARRFGGNEAGTLGGQVLVYFGFPRASDTDARRAAIVALEVAHEIRRRAELSDLPVEVRVGVHTGIVTTGGLDGAQMAMFGVTPGHAAQLAQQAPANGILVSADTFPYLARAFELEAITSPRGEHVYRLVAESRAESAVPGASRAPFIGRSHELATLERAWERAREGKGGAVLIRGEAGMGKSRLARELRRNLEKARSRWLEARCLPETEHTALSPLLDLLIHELNLSGAAGPDASRHLEAGVQELGGDPAAALPLLCPWLGLPLPEPYKPLPFSPQRQKALLLDLLVTLLVTMAERHATPILIEDLHWADPTTRECIDLLIPQVAARGCLLLLTARPDTAYQPASPDHVETLQLDSLGPVDVQQMVDGLAGRDGFSRMLVEDVVRRADGIPLFVEEIVRFIENSSSQATAVGSLDSAPKQGVPASLRDLLTGRLDQLGRAKETAQVASAIGREFDYRLLASLLPEDEAVLLADLEKMVSADLLIRRRHVDNPVYIFRHALIRDAAYESLLHKYQQQLHQQIAETLTRKFPEVAEAQPELIASHHERAGQVREAIESWMKAGHRALDRAANREAIAHLRRALALITQLTDLQERRVRELDLQLALAPALMAIEGWASPQTGLACTRARDLCHELHDQQRLFPALWGLWTFQFVGGQLEPALVTANQTLAMATAAGSQKIQLAAHHAVGFSHLYRGEFLDAREHGERGLALYTPELEREIVRTFQLSSTSACAYFRAASLWMLGYRDNAAAGLDQMYRVVREVDHLPSLASCMGFALFLHHYQEDVEGTAKLADELFALSQEQGFQNWFAVSFLYRAWARSRRGEVEQGIGELRYGIQMFRSIGARLILVGVHAMLGEALLRAGRPEEALQALADGLEEARTRGEHIHEPELHRLRGEALRASDPAAAEAAFRDALHLATAQQARSLSLRAALGLARLLADQGQRDQAAALVRAEYQWFTQGFETEDLKAARALLEALPAAGAG